MRTLLISVLLLFSSVTAADYYCLGKISHLGGSTKLSVNNGFGVHHLCKIGEDIQCDYWASLALAAELSDRSVYIYYRSTNFGGDQSAGECQNIGSWVTPTDTVYYFQISA